MKRIALLLLAVVAFAGCGQAKSHKLDPVQQAEIAAANAHLTGIEVKITDPNGFGGNLYPLSQSYIGAVEKARGVMPDDLLRDDLTRVANEVRPYCGDCAASLESERANIAGN